MSPQIYSEIKWPLVTNKIYIYNMASICGEFKFASENNYRKFLETMGAPSGLIDNIMASLENVINQIF